MLRLEDSLLTRRDLLRRGGMGLGMLGLAGVLSTDKALADTADNPLSPAAKRGQTIFEGAAKCIRCHAGPEYTSEHNYDVKLEADGSPYRRWNPPSLRGVWQRGPYLHDGRAATLADAIKLHSGQASSSANRFAGLSEVQQEELIAFLGTLRAPVVISEGREMTKGQTPNNSAARVAFGNSPKLDAGLIPAASITSFLDR